MTVIPVGPQPRVPVQISGHDPQLRAAAIQLEATFLAEMLKSAGFGAAREGFGGGIGEDQFSSFLRDAQARDLAVSGGIGLAEAFFEAMKMTING